MIGIVQFMDQIKIDESLSLELWLEHVFSKSLSQNWEKQEVIGSEKEIWSSSDLCVRWTDDIASWGYVPKHQ